MSEASRSKAGCIIAFFVWIIIALIAAVVWRYGVQPLLNEELTTETSQAGDFEHDLSIALDSFLGLRHLAIARISQRLGTRWHSAATN